MFPTLIMVKTVTIAALLELIENNVIRCSMFSSENATICLSKRKKQQSTLFPLN